MDPTPGFNNYQATTEAVRRAHACHARRACLPRAPNRHTSHATTLPRLNRSPRRRSCLPVVRRGTYVTQLPPVQVQRAKVQTLLPLQAAMKAAAAASVSIVSAGNSTWDRAQRRLPLAQVGGGSRRRRSHGCSHCIRLQVGLPDELQKSLKEQPIFMKGHLLELDQVGVGVGG